MKRLEHSRVLVTGGAGFIGSNLVETLLAQNNEVTVLDNFSTGKPENIRPFLDDKRVRLVTGDIRAMDDCRKAVDGMEYVLHEAALGSVPRSVKDPMTTTAVNILGFVNMLFSAREAGVKRFVYASSSSVYGAGDGSPKVEEKTGRQLSPYAITKYADELFAGNFHDLYGVDTVGLRYFNVFGRRQDPSGAYAAVIPKFAIRLLNHERPTVNGDGSFSRDFTHVDNVVRANELALLADAPDALNRAYNIAFGESATLNELFALLRADLAEFDPEIASIEAEYGPERPGDIPHSLADIGKAAELLGYAPEISLKQGLKKTARWYFDNLKARG